MRIYTFSQELIVLKREIQPLNLVNYSMNRPFIDSTVPHSKKTIIQP